VTGPAQGRDTATRPDSSTWVRADFNGLFRGELLCLAHSDEVTDAAGRVLRLATGMRLTAFDLDADDDGRPNKLYASGVVEPSPDWLTCSGSRWVLRIDDEGLRWTEPEG
jgi:hypothetical protein